MAKVVGYCSVCFEICSRASLLCDRCGPGARVTPGFEELISSIMRIGKSIGNENYVHLRWPDCERTWLGALGAWVRGVP